MNKSLTTFSTSIKSQQIYISFSQRYWKFVPIGFKPPTQFVLTVKTNWNQTSFAISRRVQNYYYWFHSLILLHSNTGRGLAEVQRSPKRFVDEPAQEGYSGSNSYILVTCRWPSIVEIARYGPYRLRDIKKKKRITEPSSWFLYNSPTYFEPAKEYNNVYTSWC